jgi:hypothetical protein
MTSFCLATLDRGIVDLLPAGASPVTVVVISG